MALKRQSEIEFLKLMCTINAIIGLGNSLASTLSGSGGSGNDSLNKSIDALKELLLPHWKEEKDVRAKKARELLEKEVSGGPIKVQVVGKGVR